MCEYKTPENNINPQVQYPHLRLVITYPHSNSTLVTQILQNLPQCTVTSTPAPYRLANPAFLIQDPVCVFANWKSHGYDNLDAFVVCYKEFHQRIKDTPASKIIVYEQLISDAKGTIASLYDHWDIHPPQDHMNDYKHPLENDTSHIHLSTLEIEQIENQLGTLYLESCSPYLTTIRSALSSKTWFGFDLDDTLHEFRKASSHASSSVFEAIHQESNISIDALKATYADILRSKTASAFSDGRTSTEYRRERFSSLLQIHNLHATEERLFRLLSIYQASLQTALTRKPHALTLLEKIKALNKKVIVVTEGPQDSQEWTVEQLGLRPYIDIIITTNEAGKAKVDGLFSVVLEKYHISAQDIVYIGDNPVRDILPAQEVGILAVLYDEKRDCRFDDPGVFRVNSLGKLVGLIE